MQIGLGSESSNCHKRFSLTAVGQPHSTKLRSTSSRIWLPASGQELINAISKVYFRLVLSSNKRRGGNGWKNSAKLIKQRKDSSNKACLNVLRAVNAWGERVGPSIWKGDKIAKNLGTEADTEWDNKIVRIPGQIERGDKQVGDPRQDDKGVKDPR